VSEFRLRFQRLQRLRDICDVFLFLQQYIERLLIIAGRSDGVSAA